MSDPSFKAEEAPPPQPPRPQPRSQLEQDEMYARQLAEHYQSQGGQGGHSQRTHAEGQRRQQRPNEPDREHSFFDGKTINTFRRIHANGMKMICPRSARTSSRASRRRRRQSRAGSQTSPRSSMASPTTTTSMATPCKTIPREARAPSNARTLDLHSRSSSMASASRRSSVAQLIITAMTPTTGCSVTTSRSWS